MLLLLSSEKPKLMWENPANLNPYFYREFCYLSLLLESFVYISTCYTNNDYLDLVLNFYDFISWHLFSIRHLPYSCLLHFFFFPPSFLFLAQLAQALLWVVIFRKVTWLHWVLGSVCLLLPNMNSTFSKCIITELQSFPSKLHTHCLKLHLYSTLFKKKTQFHIYWG